MKINSFMLISLSLVLFLTSTILLNRKKEQLQIIQTNLNQKIVLAKKYKDLKDNWSISKSDKILKRIIKDITLEKKNIKIEIKSNINTKSIIFKSSKIQDLDYILNKILNANIIINAISINKNKIKFEVPK